MGHVPIRHRAAGTRHTYQAGTGDTRRLLALAAWHEAHESPLGDAVRSFLSGPDDGRGFVAPLAEMVEGPRP